MVSRRPRRRRALALLAFSLALGALGTVAAITTAAFNWGFAEGMTAGTVMLIVYTVPATVLNWPRLTFTDIVEALIGLWSAIVSCIASLFDW
jgi:hypothetical protein